jgi:hypothetical protein
MLETPIRAFLSEKCRKVKSGNISTLYKIHENECRKTFETLNLMFILFVHSFKFSKPNSNISIAANTEEWFVFSWSQASEVVKGELEGWVSIVFLDAGLVCQVDS